ncbi:MAG: glycosyltransferase family 2 protein [Actinobacteria bacterium]|nr:glycosyltransferase family 2 protein [Actinomycetota bacterium]
MRATTLEFLPTTMSNEVILTFAFSTLADRVKNISYPTKDQSREFIVLVQNPSEQSYVFDSPDKKLVELKSRGVAKSRNAALKYSAGKYLIFGDDDITFDEGGIATAVTYFENNPDCSLILARAIDESGKLRKNYVSSEMPIRLTNSARVATYEMLVRVDAIRERKIRFDEDFGAGADNYLGDEYIFVADALRAGLKGVHLPINLAVHPAESSGSRWGTKEDLRARAKVFKRVFGWKAPLYRAGFLIKTENPFPGISKALRFILGR